MGKDHFTQKLQLRDEVVLFVDRVWNAQLDDILTLGLRDKASVIGEPVGAVRFEET